MGSSLFSRKNYTPYNEGENFVRKVNMEIQLTSEEIEILMMYYTACIKEARKQLQETKTLDELVKLDERAGTIGKRIALLGNVLDDIIENKS